MNLIHELEKIYEYLDGAYMNASESHVESTLQGAKDKIQGILDSLKETDELTNQLRSELHANRSK